ncbi:MAG: TrkH family potassium uptake protein [Treponema sp.]|jgi:trk system potassium uptake protein TrkH|nr:TrkH family potassium uptake protein [Treponema sp.]
MKRLSLIRLLAIILGLETFFMLPSLVMAFVLGETFMVRPFLIPLAPGAALAVAAAFCIPKSPVGIRARDGFLLVFLTWIFSSLTGSLPYYFSPLDIGFCDAVFESACGFATTGATTFSNVEALPRSLLFWRSTSHWVGGMGIILFTVALLPLLGVGGFQLVKAEAPGPEKDKLKPRITSAAKVLWTVYCSFTAALIMLYRLGGMEWFDAVCHGFSIMATGGVSTKNAGFAFFNSPFIDWVTVIFMILAALNFNMYYRIVRGKSRDLLYHTETRVYFLILFTTVLVISLSLIPQYGSFASALRFGAFQTASILTTTGNVRADFTAWPGLAQGVLFCLMFIGGCSGSTAGGIKVIRHTVLFKQAINEVRRLLYPQGVFSIQLNRKVGRKDVVYGVAGFVFLYFMIVAVTTLATAASGFDVFASLSVALSITGNIGTGFGAAGPFHNYSEFPNHLKILYSLVMIAGRLELWTVFVLITPEYWKR